ncbi:perlucin-like protein [Ostrea edulis]|uniref:perlucin-like protein n=1 Tax=Ostrea edulis TaxID=37623 RepID=UPI0024AEED52|nr:perlucin-like protein [Ostrea edulis]
MFVKIVSMVLLLLVSERIQAGKAKKCGYPFRMLGDNCYYFSTDKATWDEAYVNCVHKGGYLANLETLHEYLIIRYQLAGIKNGQNYAIGGRDFNREKKGSDWRWVGYDRVSRMSYFAFGPSEPNGTKGSPELCLWLYAGYKYQFIDVACTSVARYICEK